MNEFTKGQWFYEVKTSNEGDGFISIQSRKTFDAKNESDDPTIAGIYSLDPVDFANAKLMCASTFLLDALREFVIVGDDIGRCKKPKESDLMRLMRVLDNAKSAIKKATTNQ